MTYSILSRDAETGAIAGATAAGCLGAGGWVLRGSVRGGISASQGASPSCIWGEEVLTEMARGHGAAEAVDLVTGRDSGKSWRQLAALDSGGGTGAFTGNDTTDFKGALRFRNGVASGDLLPDPMMLEAMVNAFIAAEGPLPGRLIAGLEAVSAQGGDAPVSAALLVLERDRAPLSLRIDFSEAPLAELRNLLERAGRAPYRDWARRAPCPADPERHPGSATATLAGDETAAESASDPG